MAGLSHFLQPLADTTASDPSVSTAEAQLAGLMVPALGLPFGALANVRVLVQLSSLTAANVVTLRLRRGSLAGEAVMSFTVNAAGVVVEQVGTIASEGGELLLLTGQITTGVGTAALGAASVLIEAQSQAAPFPLAPTMVDDGGLGSDIDVFDALPGTFRLARGLQNLGNALARRLQTPRGFHHQAFGGDPDYGYDLVSRLNGSWGPADLAAVGSLVEEQFRLDERVLEAQVVVRYSHPLATLEVDSTVVTEAGPFRLIMSVRSVGIELVLPAQET